MNLALGNKLSLRISDLAFGGEGVARWEDFVVFVPFVAVGELVEAEITELKKRYARARLLRVLEPSPERVEPGCRYFGACGGCQYQHLAYSAQLRLKHKQIGDLFERLGHFDRRLVAPVIPCPQPYGYRNRIMVRSQWDKFKQGLNIGFIRADSRLVVDVEECRLAEPALNEQLKYVRAHPPPKGGLKVVLRSSPPGWEVPPDSFFQNNSFLLPKLVEVARDALRQAQTKHLLDIYCGVGFFSVELAPLAESFVGVELDHMAIQAARRNAAARARTNGEFIAGTAEEQLPAILSRFPAPATTVLLDPPRKGCQPETLQMLRRVQPAQIIYISCHPATMARDLNILCAQGAFELAQVRPLDMFPHTQHVECVGDLRCKAATGSP
ncbi:MAG: class I SAM-dependent RNA methyltransferase [Verrucomicrobia bacterium]|nr:class I SAM-dependent RNA methyltransferase [Verrucomicrobiota bacterium]OQC26719.1 MAG: 23S rRNA (uracil(1939)-C(5))-methyltransferase RlmD [Verrucomicrobia bacterium ADurb.Bin063]HNW06251.1 class I SAM-dependent RNA methyltransferase [Verrucomicrobiota bacterium]HNZ76167.1 class I SAM-dependent RNA methyltransferase [Verrucomicrobiota bacterium]HOC49907.1 class I SAM-dependent RNA methyltransferase [Verrucomicrobiota bacterium]